MDLRQTDLNEKELKRFGFIFGSFAIVIAIWQVFCEHWGHVYVLAPLAIYVLVMAFVRPAWIYPVRRVMELIFKAVMWIVTNTVLGICFYLVFAPIGLIMRLCGKDLLNQKIEKGVQTYWITRETRDFDPDHYKKQF